MYYSGIELFSLFQWRVGCNVLNSFCIFMHILKRLLKRESTYKANSNISHRHFHISETIDKIVLKIILVKRFWNAEIITLR